MPPSSSTSTCPPTAAATAGRARMVAGVPSRSLPPWLDTDIAVAPASTARLASSMRVMPLTRNGPAPQLAQPGYVLPGRRRRGGPLGVGAEERGRGLARRDHVRHRQVRRAEGPGVGGQPPRPHYGLRRVPHYGRQVYPLGDLRATPVPAVGER